jgi:very-short-patch-repair endonuclease
MKNTMTLIDNGIRVLRFWEHDVADNLPGCVREIEVAIHG